MSHQVLAMLPCADIDEIAEFYALLGFETTYRQTRPNPYLVVEGHGFPLHYYGLEGHRPENSHSTCGVVVDDTEPVFTAFAARLRAEYGKLPMTGYPRITRPRPRKNAGGLTGFSLVDPAGNWIRFLRRPGQEPPAEPASRLGDALLNAIVLADSKGDPAQAAKILQGAVGRADADDPAMPEALDFLAELGDRVEPDR
ncbi:MAG: VOC family protein [Aeromicrobium sp.]